jgi:putative transposase
MKCKRYSVEQIVAAVKPHELGTSVSEIVRKLGIAEQTFYRWKKQYGGLEPDQARELKQVKEENARLKKIVADLSLDKAMLQDIAAKKWSALRSVAWRRAI